MTMESVTAASVRAGEERFSGWRMVVIAFLAQNCAVGMNLAVYGTLVQAIEREFSTTRALAAVGPGIMTLSMGLLSPVVGWLTGRISLRTMMIAGATVCAIGYGLLCFTTNIYALLAIFALVIGPGVAALGVVPASALIGHWFIEGRGRALGIINTPFSLLVFPFMAAFVLSHYGLKAVFVTVAGVLVLLMPLLMTIVQRPEDIGQRPLGSGAATGPGEVTSGQAELTAKQLISTSAFWVVTLAVSLLTATALVIVTHLVALALGRGVGLGTASMLLGISGGMGIVGSLVFGWLCDRVGPRWAFVANTAGAALAWLGLLYAGASLPALVTVTLLIGMFTGSIIALFSASMGAWLGKENMGRAMGLSYLIQAPFMFGAGPLAGYLFEVTGSYDAPILSCIGIFAALTVMFLLYRPRAAA